mmetsp:Transcript_19342/g.54111  ORF Transcript_19342/g.54111 Transcript_19342/m.54111 type:complete len:231 (+) Transcript_19342:51-743(+)|eukprot:CAMPEP_0202422850 /NCGR_PEP_ID=MMETSP1128-20130828/51074_1 /ASSEMBLY_ACC=CAM_ASM_000463 /TAXON_ID=3047 /ORGANISM="Dunaliella tertiolecta, Strain CCMP1320" /LENGTH=230 /DNA_ID=CAMNT_0049030931 /DNA_START=1497 /DNA_END=2189 /DNA_ORIENTATION=-
MTKIYVGNLPLDVRERELDDLFYKFGKIRLIDIKTPSRPPAYGFVEFDDPRDAEEAVRRRDNYDFGGYRIRVEVARGASGAGARDGFNRPPKATPFRCLVKGLPRGASWQDLKDHMRRAAKPLYTDVRTDRDGKSVGIVEFESFEDMKAAIRKLDDSEFNNPRYDRGCYIRIVEENPGSYRGRSPSVSRSPPRRGRSDSRSPRRSLSPDEDKPRRSSPSRSRSRSRSVSR